MGYEGEFPTERFLGEAKRVEIFRGKVRVIRKQGECGQTVENDAHSF